MTIRDMVARHSDYADTKDFIPTPPWATRALYEHVAPALKTQAPRLDAWDPAYGQGHMLKVMAEYGHKQVFGSDIVEYEDQVVKHNEANIRPMPLDFTSRETSMKTDVIITNPPYAKLYDFVDLALERTSFGVGMLVRVQSLESEERYYGLYKERPPTQIGFFANRIPFKSGKVMKKAPKMFFHVWLWWQKDGEGKLVAPNPPTWIPWDAQTQLEKETDYE